MKIAPQSELLNSANKGPFNEALNEDLQTLADEICKATVSAIARAAQVDDLEATPRDHSGITLRRSDR